MSLFLFKHNIFGQGGRPAKGGQAVFAFGILVIIGFVLPCNGSCSKLFC